MHLPGDPALSEWPNETSCLFELVGLLGWPHAQSMQCYVASGFTFLDICSLVDLAYILILSIDRPLIRVWIWVEDALSCMFTPNKLVNIHEISFLS